METGLPIDLKKFLNSYILSNPQIIKFNYLGMLFTIYHWGRGLVEDRSLGMRKAAGSIPADSIINSYYGHLFLSKLMNLVD